jgi:hypothetical protein
MNSCDPFFFSCRRGDKIHSPNTSVMYRIQHYRSPVDVNIRRTRRAKVSHKRALKSWIVGKAWRGYLPIKFLWHRSNGAGVLCMFEQHLLHSCWRYWQPYTDTTERIAMDGEDTCGMVFFLSAYWFVPFSSFGRISTIRKRDVAKVITAAVCPICVLYGHCLPC